MTDFLNLPVDDAMNLFKNIPASEREIAEAARFPSGNHPAPLEDPDYG